MRNVLIAAAAGLAAVPAAAHHSFDMFFDRDKLVKVTGRVEAFAFARPHAYITLKVGEGAAAREWHAETGSAGELAAHGWTASSIRPGQVLTVEGWPARDGHPYMRIRSLAKAGGASLTLWMPPGPAPRLNNPG